MEENSSQSLLAKRSCWDLQHASRVRGCSLYASDVNLWEVPVNTVHMCEYNVVPCLTPHMGLILYLRQLGTIASMSLSPFSRDEPVQSFAPSMFTCSADVRAAEFDRTFVPFFTMRTYILCQLANACRQACDGTGMPELHTCEAVPTEFARAAVVSKRSGTFPNSTDLALNSGYVHRRFCWRKLPRFGNYYMLESFSATVRIRGRVSVSFHLLKGLCSLLFAL